MNRFVIAVALSIALVACSHASEQGKNYTITSFWPVGPENFFFPLDIYFGYVHSEHAHDWEIYKQSSYEVCAEKSACWAIWFDGEAPESADEYEEDEHRFVIVAVFAIKDGEVAWSIDCDFIDVPDADRTDPDKSSVECEDGRIEL